MLGKLSATDKKTVTFSKPRYTLDFRNTNRLVHNDNWKIDLTKTGFTNAAGHCLVMRTQMGRRQVAFVVLDTKGKLSPVGDANRLRTWIEISKVTPLSSEAKQYKKQRSQEQIAKISDYKADDQSHSERYALCLSYDVRRQKAVLESISISAHRLFAMRINSPHQSHPSLNEQAKI